MTRAEIIELIQNKYDRKPDHLPPNSGWDDGTGEIADTICARITELDSELSTVRGESERAEVAIENLNEARNELAAAKVRIGELEFGVNILVSDVKRFRNAQLSAEGRVERAESSLFTANAEIDWMRARIANAAIEVLKTNKDARVRQVEARANIALESMRNEVQVLREALEHIAWNYTADAISIARLTLANFDKARAALTPAKAKEEGND